MNENEILDDLPYEEDQILSQELIDAVVACAKYAKIFVFITVTHNIMKFIMNISTMIEHESAISNIYGSFRYYVLLSSIFTLITFISAYFLWQFAKKGGKLASKNENEFVNTLQSLKHYFIAFLTIAILWRALQYLGPLLGQFIAF